MDTLNDKDKIHLSGTIAQRMSDAYKQEIRIGQLIWHHSLKLSDGYHAVLSHVLDGVTRYLYCCATSTECSVELCDDYKGAVDAYVLVVGTILGLDLSWMQEEAANLRRPKGYAPTSISERHNNPFYSLQIVPFRDLF